jgi:hypothetical protein
MDLNVNLASRRRARRTLLMTGPITLNFDIDYIAPTTGNSSATSAVQDTDPKMLGVTEKAALVGLQVLLTA